MNFDLPLSHVWTVPGHHPHVVMPGRVSALSRITVVIAIGQGRHVEVVFGPVSLQRRRGFTVLTLGGLRLHVIVRALAARSQLWMGKGFVYYGY